MSVKNIVASHQTGFLASLLLFQCLEWLGPLFQLCRILCSPCTAVKEIVLCSVGILSKSIMSKSFSGVGIKLGYKEKRWINEMIFDMSTHNEYLPHAIQWENVAQKVEIFAFECFWVFYPFLEI